MSNFTNTPQRPGLFSGSFGIGVAEVAALLAIFVVYAGDPAPAVNEAHYLVKAKNFWDPSFCPDDLFASSGKAHTTFYWTFGSLTRWVSLDSAAWVGRVIGWLMLAIGLRRCSHRFGLPAYASIGVALGWIAGVEYANLAGEWVVGGIEAKVPAYAMVLMGVSEVAVRNWSRGWIWFGAASAFHVLTGGWAVIAAMISFAVTERWRRAADEPRIRFFSWGLLIGGALSLFGLLPALQLTLGATPEQSAEAARIYSYVRIRHHLLPSDFPLQWYLRHATIVAALTAIVGSGRPTPDQRRLLWIGLGAACIAGGGLAVGTLPALIPDLAARLLRYYWFRLSDAMVPLAVALWLMRVITSGGRGAESRSTTDSSPRERHLARLVLAIAVTMVALSVFHRNQLGIPPATSHRLLGVDPDADFETQRQTHRDWVAVCDWLRIAMPSREIFLTPRHQQTFKWYSGHGEVVNWKDVPQNASALLEWSRRFDDVFPKRVGSVSLNSMRVPIGYAKLREYRRRYGVRFMVVDNRIATDSVPLVKIYPSAGQRNQTYSVYELPAD